MIVTFHEKIDSGAFGDVWRATDSLDRQVAVKIIRSAGAGVSDALDHAKALARASHPNVVVVYNVEKVRDPDTGSEADGIVMELLRGQTLEDRIEGPALTLEEVRSIGFGAIDGLEHIHAQGLTHGDLHNKNVMVDGGQVKIIDILYLDSLAALTTQSQKERRRRDLVSLRLILQDLLCYSELDPGERTEFNNLLHTSSDIAAIRLAFDDVTSPDSTHDAQRLLDHAFRRVTDENFVEGDKYASALKDETPRTIVLPLLKKLIEERQFAPKHRAYVRALWSTLTEDEIAEIVQILNVRLEEDTPNGNWCPNLRLVARLGKELWHRLSPAIRIKLESMITNDILSGRYDIYGGATRSGSLGTYVNTLWPVFSNPEAVIDNIESMLHQGWYTQNYIAKNFLATLPKIAHKPEDRARLIDALAVAVRNDAKIVVDRLSELPDDWVKEVEKQSRR
jgi:serine/threonine protein kinase